MNSEIKFRGMTISGEWVYGYVRQNANPRMKHQGWFIADSMHNPLAFEVRPETIGQYTGLKDKNGKEIYKDDILKFTLSSLKYKNKVFYGLVVFEKGRFFTKYNIKDSSFGVDAIDSGDIVVGNKHENPELMNKIMEVQL